ncbi:hypothetical protein SCHPADRAFT_825533 [Schizopora paradoxa]|uniref:BHLH domain-containing protein n=1 Tax=Schizopora paradoxa TaxID=27342 RepID=A0A0H2RSK5_9AGAM|nr:hypothetical protein SCHPADRAFT_825533 [Schizopora paradoxa]
MEVDTTDPSKQASCKSPGSAAAPSTSAPSDSQNFDYNMRRHSVPGGESRRLSQSQSSSSQPRVGSANTGAQAGAKRKMSMDRTALPSVGEEIDPQLIGPGSHSSAQAEGDEPASKRRNSAFDTQKIAQLSISDRRDSIDSRMSASTPSWWSNDRRDSSSSMLSSASIPSSVGFNSPGFSGEGHGRQPGSIPAFAWPPTGGPNDPTPVPPAPPGQGQVDPNFARPYDSQIPPPTTVSSNMPLDRRLSVPDTMPSASSSRPERVLRSRSRPPSRTTAAGRAGEMPPGVVDATAGSESKTEESPNSASPTNSPLHERGTPYSRSPELRVSHKLAERKRRKEMRDLFDELRDQLPADRGMKASKWEILSKAIDFISQIKQNMQETSRENEMLRHELDSIRHGGVAFPHPAGPHAVMYAHGPPPVGVPYPPTGPPLPSQQPQVGSRPGSSQTTFAGPGANQGPTANGKP